MESLSLIVFYLVALFVILIVGVTYGVVKLKSWIEWIKFLKRH